jgi:predicted ATPase
MYQKPKFLKTKFDPLILTMPFKIQTQWHVITGAPSSGKTTLINLMAERGLTTVPEPARQYMETQMAKGQTIDEVEENLITLQLGIVDHFLKVQSGLPEKEVLFLDGGFPDSITYGRVHGLDPNEFLSMGLVYRYASVHKLERLPFEQDGVRWQDDATVAFIDEWLTKDYEAMGYHVVNVPVMPVEARLAFILRGLTDRGLIDPSI